MAGVSDMTTENPTRRQQAPLANLVWSYAKLPFVICGPQCCTGCRAKPPIPVQHASGDDGEMAAVGSSRRYWSR